MKILDFLSKHKSAASGTVMLFTICVTFCMIYLISTSPAVVLIREMNFSYLLLALLLFALAHFFAMLRWYLLIRPQGQNIYFRDIAVRYLGNLTFARLLPAYLGEFSRALSTRNAIGGKRSLIVVLIEVYSEVIVLVSFALYGIYITFEIKTFAVYVCVYIILLTPLIFGIFPKHTPKLWVKARSSIGLEQFICTRGNFILVFACSFFAILAVLLFTYQLFHAFHIPIRVGEIFLIQPLVTVASMLPVTLGGVGIREFAMVNLYAPHAETSAVLLVGGIYSLLSVLVFPLFGALFLFPFLRSILDTTKHN
jgi:glycosyltransferase 2 family protein